MAIRLLEFWRFGEWPWPFAVLENLKIWPFTSSLAIRLFWPFVGPDRVETCCSLHALCNLHGVSLLKFFEKNFVKIL